MGMFDNITCNYPLPVKEAQDCVFQTKDTGAQYMDNYEIREDGTLWHEERMFRWVDEPDKPIIKGHFDVIESNWVFEKNFTGEIEFYTFIDGNKWNT
jgi:hypothetical protein